MQIFGDAIRFGIHSGQQNATYDQYLHLWQRAEELGYDWASDFDHFIPMASVADPAGPCLEGLTLLGALAAKTERIRCGNLVIGVTYRNPAILAKMAATIDQISHGRLEFGIGAGWYEAEHQQYGIPFPSAGTRIRMLAETAQILRQLWSQETTTFHGAYYTLNEARCEPKGLQSPIPLWIGGAGEQKTMRVVAEYADGWNTFGMPLDDWRHKLDVLAGHCRAVGRDPRDIRKSLVFRVQLGESQAEVEALRRAGGDRRAGFVGTPEECVEYLLPYTGLQVGDFLFGMSASQGPDAWRTMELIASKVAPAVKAQAKTAQR